MLAAVPSAGIMFAYLGFEQADQLAGEIKNPQRNLPRAIIYAVLIGTAIYLLLQVVFIGAMPTNLLTHGFGGISSTSPIALGPFTGLAALAGLAWLAAILRVDAFISPVGTGLMYIGPPPHGWDTAWPGTGTTRRSSPRPTRTAFPGSA